MPLTQHFQNCLFGLRLFALSMHGRILPESGRFPDPEAHPHVQEHHDRHRDQEEEERRELKQVRRGRLDRAERGFGDRLEERNIFREASHFFANRNTTLKSRYETGPLFSTNCTPNRRL